MFKNNACIFSVSDFCLESWSDGNATVIGDPAPSAAEIVEVPGLTVVLSQQSCWVAVDLIPAR